MFGDQLRSFHSLRPKNAKRSYRLLRRLAFVRRHFAPTYSSSTSLRMTRWGFLVFVTKITIMRHPERSEYLPPASSWAERKRSRTFCEKSASDSIRKRRTKWGRDLYWVTLVFPNIMLLCVKKDMGKCLEIPSLLRRLAFVRRRFAPTYSSSTSLALRSGWRIKMSDIIFQSKGKQSHRQILIWKFFQKTIDKYLRVVYNNHS